MPQRVKLFLFLGTINAMAVIILGAFGAHALKERLSEELMVTYQTAVAYHIYHAIGLILIGLIALKIPHSPFILWSGWLMVAGILLFSGSLYLLSMSGMKWLGAITPIGGTAWIAAWLLLALGILKS